MIRRMLLDTGRQAGASFALFDHSYKDLYFTIKQNLTDGLSIIYNRNQEVGQTHIRNNKLALFQKIL